VLLVSSAADANILINLCRMAAQRYLFAYQVGSPTGWPACPVASG
jgi:hypothetical protein